MTRTCCAAADEGLPRRSQSTDRRACGISFRALSQTRIGYIVESVQTVLYYFFRTDSFESCLTEVVNRGEDADTNGAGACWPARPMASTTFPILAEETGQADQGAHRQQRRLLVLAQNGGRTN